MPTSAATFTFTVRSTLDAQSDQLAGEMELRLNSAEALYNVAVLAIGAGHRAVIGRTFYWEPTAARTFRFSIPARHDFPGGYHLLLEIDFQDKAGAHLTSPLAIPYGFGVSTIPVATRHRPDVAFTAAGIRWNLDGLPPDAVELAITAGPAWTASAVQPAAIHPAFTHNGVTALPRHAYTQLATLGWSAEGRHFSTVFDWTLRTNADGAVAAVERGEAAMVAGASTLPMWRQPDTLWYLALGLLVAVILCRGLRFSRQQAPKDATAGRMAGPFLVLALTLWLAAHLSPALWVTTTWPTGGDVASHVLYAHTFSQWLASGRISGWMPEVFAGFPAFTFYFPLPFVLVALLAKLGLAVPVAFKWVSITPALLLPAATYVMGALMHWPVAMRVFGALGAAGFILGTETSIWGGNLAAELAGEFSYAWGMVGAALFWGVTARSLAAGGRWWIVAGAIEALVALSHGYALLIAGFGAFGFLLFSPHVWRDLRAILQIHLLAFLLIGFWLIPLVENLPWTIPNDTSAWIERWTMLAPASLWPFAPGLLAALIALRLDHATARGLGVLAGIGLLGTAGFVLGHRVGLAEVRAFPYAQWALAVAAGAGLGALLAFWNRRAVAWAATAMVALMAWWEPGIEPIERWARWNLEGYEAKPMWAPYRQLAEATAGSLHAPRILFEHDPDNNDIGSTRALEALPLFGSRPVLEGLYMESAITGPFVYQVQAETSARPSSPLGRFPATIGSVDQAVAHMQELYADTLVLRSNAMKARFAADRRYTTLADIEPFLVLRLNDFHSGLVDVVTTPLDAAPRRGWLDDAHRRFIAEFPYSTRHVYRTAAEPPPPVVAATHGGTARIVSMERERLVFETDAVGQAHLIRMSYHPRWRAATGEHIWLVEPSFMLIVPEHNRIELIYGRSWGIWLGWIVSALGVAFLAVALRAPRCLALTVQPTPTATPRLRRLAVVTAVTLATVAALWWHDPERAYAGAHRDFAAGAWAQAAVRFDRAFAGRSIPGQRAEAAFWAGRSYDLAGLDEAAMGRYGQIIDQYPENYWYAEAVYRLIVLQRDRGNVAAAKTLLHTLESHRADDQWTVAGRKALAPLP